MENTQTPLLDRISEELSYRGYEAKIHEVQKVNTNQKALSVMTEGSFLSPTFYEDSFVEMAQKDMTIDQMADVVLGYAEKNDPDIAKIALNLHDREFLMDNAFLCVCNDKCHEFLSDIPHQHIDGTDLSAYARILVSPEASTVPHYDFLSSVGIPAEAFLERAKTNSFEKGYEIKTITEAIEEASGQKITQNKEMLVITNKEKVYGASAITDIDTLEIARQMLGAKEVYVIPSSVHEILMLDAGQISPSHINEMIRSINQAEVKDNEVLGEQAYLYDGSLLSITHEKQQAHRKGR